MPHRHLVHGDVVAADVPIAALDAPAAAEPDVVLDAPAVGELPPGHPAGEVLLEGSGTWPTSIVRVDSGVVVVRFADAYEVRISADGRRIKTVVAPGRPVEFVRVLQHGAVLAARHVLAGDFALHATTVALDGRGIAIAGPSGQGKTTTAALLVGAGAVLVSDDVTVLRAAARTHVWPGPLELRLRDAAVALASLVGDAEVRATPDERLGVRPAAAPAPGGVPLAAIVLPRPDRTGRSVRVHALDPIEAVPHLLAASRLVGWRSPDILARDFSAAAELADTVPVHVVDIPWGPPFRGELTEELHRAFDGYVPH